MFVFSVALRLQKPFGLLRTGNPGGGGDNVELHVLGCRDDIIIRSKHKKVQTNAYLLDLVLERYQSFSFRFLTY